jgi:replicative DNA helicase
MQKRNYRDVAQSDPLQLIGKTPPSSLEAERAVLGSLLFHEEHIAAVLERLAPGDFYTPAHRLIYETIIKIFEQQRRIDLVTLQDELEKAGNLDAVGGMVYLISLQEEIPMAGLVEQHAKIIKDKSILRELINSASSIIANCYTQDDKRIEAVLDEAQKKIFQISEFRTQQSFIQLTIWLKKTFQHLSDIKEQGSGITGVNTGFKHLNEMTSGFQNNDFIVLAARPSMGKTALALNFAQAAARDGLVVGFFSLEMSAEQLVLRLLSTESEIGHHHIRNASISSDQWIELTHVAARLAESKLFIDDTAMQSILDIRSKARRLKRDHGLQILVIDYLQLIHSTKAHENRHQEVSEISRSLKALAKELSIPVIALSQLSRAVESRLDKRPMLSDLRESGAIEQDADLIMFLYRDIVYNADTEDPSLSEIIIGKQRNGPTGTVKVQYQRELTSFVDYDD